MELATPGRSALTKGGLLLGVVQLGKLSTSQLKLSELNNVITLLSYFGANPKDNTCSYKCFGHDFPGLEFAVFSSWAVRAQ